MFKNNAGRTDGPTDRRTDGPTDGHDLLWRCVVASKKVIKWKGIDSGAKEPPFTAPHLYEPGKVGQRQPDRHASYFRIVEFYQSILVNCSSPVK